jgi:transmembrane sensor
MKKKNYKWEEYSDREWEFLASCLSGENGSDIADDSCAASESNTAELWKLMEKIRDEESGKTDTDRAWAKLHSRLKENNLIPVKTPVRQAIMGYVPLFIRIAAIFVLVAGMGWAALYMLRGGGNEMMLVSTGGSEKNIVVDLPDGSRVILNHDTELRYPAKFENDGRKVLLTGEAFFDIVSDPSNPFMIDAGKATIRVLGTSFNVNTSNSDDEVEVYVKSGRVLFTATDGSDSLQLEEGFMGITVSGNAEKRPNENPNYLAWNSGSLIYEGTRLETVFRDLYSVYGIEISLSDQQIKDFTITTIFEGLTEEELIRIISSTFNLSWRKEGRVYVLSQ